MYKRNKTLNRRKEKETYKCMKKNETLKIKTDERMKTTSSKPKGLKERDKP